MKRTLIALVAIAVLFFGWLTLSANAADYSPQAMQPSGFTTSQEAEILMVASGTGALAACAIKYGKPAFEATAKTIYMDVLSPLFTQPTQHNRDMLSQTTMMMFQSAMSSAKLMRMTWDEGSKSWRPVWLDMDSVETCQALDDSLRNSVTRAGNPFGYGPEFKVHGAQNA